MVFHSIDDYHVMYAEEQLYIAIANLVSKQDKYIHLRDEAIALRDRFFKEIDSQELSDDEKQEIKQAYNDSTVGFVIRDASIACNVINNMQTCMLQHNLMPHIDLQKLRDNGMHDTPKCARIIPNRVPYRIPDIDNDNYENIDAIIDTPDLDFVVLSFECEPYFNLFNDYDINTMMEILTYKSEGQSKPDYLNNIINCADLIDNVIKSMYVDDDCEMFSEKDYQYLEEDDGIVTDSPGEVPQDFKQFVEAKYGSQEQEKNNKEEQQNDVEYENQDSSNFVDEDDMYLYSIQQYVEDIYVFSKVLDYYIKRRQTGLGSADDLPYTSDCYCVKAVANSAIQSVCNEMRYNNFFDNPQLHISKLIEGTIDDIDGYLNSIVYLQERRQIIEGLHEEWCEEKTHRA